MKKLVHDIHSGKKIKENLLVYRDMAVKTYSEYAALELTFSAYMLLQEMLEENIESAEKEENALELVLCGLGKIAEEQCDYDAVMNIMKKLRKEITAKMDLFTAYTDRLICYEYVLNRMELNYASKQELDKILKTFREDEYMAALSNYMFGDKDQSVVRDKMRLVIGQVPVHMTKNKFFEKISEALTLYKGGERAALDDFIYMLRTSSMVYEPAYSGDEYEDMQQALSYLASANYTEMTQQEYVEAKQILDKATQSMHDMTDFYCSLQKVVNGIYAMCMIMPYMTEQSNLVKESRSIWASLAKQTYRDEMLMPLEGKIEEIVEKAGYLESVLYEGKSAHANVIEELNLVSFWEDFTRVANLMSDSLFIDLEKVASNEVADEVYVQECTDKLLDELSEKMSELSRPVKRAVMGQILEKLPMMFRNTEEVLEYLRVNLMGCQNKAEKAIVLTLLWDLMQEEKDWMGEE